MTIFAYSGGKTNRGQAGNYRTLWGEQCEPFKWIDRAAHAFKHVHSNGRPIEDGGDILTRYDLEPMVDFSAETDQDPADLVERYKIAPIFIRTGENVWKDLWPIMEAAADFVSEKIKRQGG